MIVILAFVISLIIVAGTIGSYYFVRGILPASRIIVSDPPIPQRNIPENTATFMFFYTQWCPHCENAQPIWASLKTMYDNAASDTDVGVSLKFEEIDCEANKGKTALYNVKAYPTFKLQTHKKVYEFIGKPTVATLQAFVKTALANDAR
jgi:thiol-disulfide isomerase/thioredoxin